jgi:hypothetical protein
VESLAQALENTRASLRIYLQSPESKQWHERCVAARVSPGDAPAALAALAHNQPLPATWQAIAAESGWTGIGGLGRWLLIQAGSRSLGQVSHLRVIDEVKQLICAEYRFYAESSNEEDWGAAPESREYRGMAAISILQRFVAGQMHWTISGVPRSWLLKMTLSDSLRCLAIIAGMRGWSPCFEAHLARRGKAPVLVPRDYILSYLRAAQSMRLQPEIRGIIGSSWLHSQETMTITPHLNWINRLFLDNGGVLLHLGQASPDSGFLVGSEKRRELYEAGEYRPREALFIWPRKPFLAWAHRASQTGTKARVSAPR